jgi:ribosomal protein S18 acetylase RimI-like enzyme
VRKLSIVVLLHYRDRRRTYGELLRSGAATQSFSATNVASGGLNLAERGGKEMTGDPRGAESPVRTRESLERRDAKILHDAVREAVRTSPDSFLKTVDDVDAKSLDYWIDEIRSSTWVVAEREGRVVGVAAAKRPDRDKDKEDPESTRYIESVWIAPELRGVGFGQGLIRYLLEAECRKSQHIRHFMLWVFTANFTAIRLYEYMGFVRTLEKNEGIKTEVKYRLDFGHLVNLPVRPVVSEAIRRSDEQRYETTHRVLGEKDSE